jgi:hypothetical protein
MEDDTEWVELNPPSSPVNRSNKVGATCQECGKELPDGRQKWCAEHKPSKGKSVRDKLTGGRSSKKGVTATVENGMNETVGKILFLITLAYAYSALRRNGIPDPNGQISDAMALTDDESVLIGKPIARLFLSTERGRAVAPTIVDNRDLIDAAFAAWDWFQRVNSTLEQYGNQQSVHTPMVVPERGNDGDSSQAQRDRVKNNGNVAGPQYVGPTPQDLLSIV